MTPLTRCIKKINRLAKKIRRKGLFVRDGGNHMDMTEMTLFRIELERADKQGKARMMCDDLFRSIFAQNDEAAGKDIEQLHFGLCGKGWLIRELFQKHCPHERMPLGRKRGVS